MSTSKPSMELYPDPLRKGGKQAQIWTQLVCSVCDLDLSGPRTEGIIDLKTGKAFCGTGHYEARRAR